MVSSSSLVELELLVGGLQLAGGPLVLVGDPPGGGGVEEADADAQYHAAGVDERDDVDFQVAAAVAAAGGPFDVVEHDLAALGVGAVDAGAEVGRPVGELQVLQGPRQVARPEVEQDPRPFVGHRERAVDVDDDLGDGVGVEDALADPDVPDQVVDRLLAAGPRHVHQPLAQVAPGDLGEDPALQVHRDERIVVGQERLGLAEEEEPALVQREVEPLEDAGLGLGVEVHQGVAAGQEVDPGDRRVLDQVVAAEDHRAAEVLVEGVSAVVHLEVLLQQRGGDAMDLPGPVGRQARRARASSSTSVA